MDLIAKAPYSLKDLEEDLQDPMSAQREILKNILTALQSVKYLKDRGIGPETTMEEYTQTYPITTYDDYESLFNAVADGVAKPSELTGVTSDEGNDEEQKSKDALLGFFMTSGTSKGKNKLIPKMKNDLALRFGSMGLVCETLVRAGLPDIFQGPGLSVAQKGHVITTASGLMAGGATSLSYVDPISRSMVQKSMTSPIEIALLDSPYTVVVYAHLLVGLVRRKEVLRMSNPYVNQTLDLFLLLEEKFNLVVDHLRYGISETVEGLVDQDSLKILRPILSEGNPSLADFVEKECGAGFDAILPRIFPNCAYILSITSGTMLPYAEKMKKYTGTIPIISPLYGASEATIGLNLDPLQRESPDAPLYTLLPRSTSFLEFQPFGTVGTEEENKEDNDNSAPVTMDKLQIGGTYEIIVTSYNCLFRYRLGDVIRVVRFEHNTPVVFFLHRSSAVLSLCNELMTERHLMDAVLNVNKEYGDFNIKDFVIDADRDCVPPRYIMYYEKEGDAVVNPLDIATALDRALMIVNSNYQHKRDGKRLAEVKAIEVESGTFGRYKELMFTTGTDPGQYKVPRVVNNKRLKSMLLESKVD